MPSDAVAPKRHRWWLAALLNLFGWLGVGYLYVRQPRRALVAAALNASSLILLWHDFGGWIAEPWIIFAAFGLTVVLTITFAVDAARLAARASALPARWYNHWSVYLAVWLVGLAASMGADAERSVRLLVIPSGSMEPTLRVGDHFVTNLKAYEKHQPERGDVVLFRLPRDESIVFVKRVIGLPGDEVQVKDGTVYVNGAAVPTEVVGEYVTSVPYASQDKRAGRLMRESLGMGRSAIVLDAAAGSPYDNTDVFKVPAGHYFVLGDNRDNSTDSRDQSLRFGVGYVPRDHIIGKIAWIYWAGDWARIGRRVE